MKIRRFVDMYYNKCSSWGRDIISRKTEFQFWDEKDKEWKKIPTEYKYHYPFDKEMNYD